MAKNRLKLDFSLKTSEERTLFLNKYLTQELFLKTPLTDAEAEMCGNYILWGKSNETNTSLEDDGYIEIETKHNTWNTNRVESLESLYESETFNESTLHPLDSILYKAPRTEKFSRSDARKNPELAAQLEPIWRQIDTLELILNFYDLAHGKRKKPPREELLTKFSESEIASLNEKSTHLNIYQYLKRRHLLVELRKEQYTISDQFRSSLLLPRTAPRISEVPEVEESPIYPFRWDENSSLFFMPFAQLLPKNFSPQQLLTLSNMIWQQNQTSLAIDFRNPDHIIEILKTFDVYADSVIGKTLLYYISESEFDEMYSEILDLKLHHARNQDIATHINEKYHKSYTTNYISTIYHKKIIPQIAETAQYHERILSNLFFPENFKQCNTCRKTYLIDPINFVRKTRSYDGFTNKCKNCDKETRAAKKETKK